MFGPLNFREFRKENLENSQETGCPLCDDLFNLKICFDIFLKHLFEVHNLVIEDVQNIYNLEKYLKYWKDKFKTNPIENIVPSISVDINNKYFLLSSLLKDDKKLRHSLELERVLSAQEFERNDTSFSKECLFCKFYHHGCRAVYLQHLSEQHNLQLGNPQNLVFIDELITEIENKLNNLQCIYCEKIFPDRHVLKEHMRKKIHKRVNRQNASYNKFYIVNYLENDPTLRIVRDDDVTIDKDENLDSEYSDWLESESSINCLFCAKSESQMDLLIAHMQLDHGFKFLLNLNFYQRIKLVNYIRKKLHEKCCHFCDTAFKTISEVFNHLEKENHCKIPDIQKFDQPEFYFPTYENDALLYFIEDTSTLCGGEETEEDIK
ncbi:PREDICTED: zinc finger protein 277 [Nicrophorus vespilloides]|uniref:Zinc finger protein 277 n=1 Tax=Nicrophorus vespilloides TaxID=110193 RepID=A0ABM1MWG1_NICVS|nr:PREDICTED: zinc finger protein 277 [Nicrophorus vespilloides]